MIEKNVFPIFKNIPNLIYLDSAATTQKPKILLDSLSEYYFNHNSNVGRGLYELAYLSEQDYIWSKDKIASFFHTQSSHLVMTSSSTESLNLSSFLIEQIISEQKKKYILLPITEHHANILTWQRFAKKHNLTLFWLDNPTMIEHPESISKDILENTLLLSMSHVSNVTGEVYPIEKWCQIAKKYNFITSIDGSQAVHSLSINLKNIDCDFYSFSTHKLYGPMGLGVLFISPRFQKYEPFKLGGGIVEDVNTSNYTLIDEITKFEAGTPNVANTYSFAKVLEFLDNQNWKNQLQEMHDLYNYLLNKMQKNSSIHILNFNKNFSKTHILSFTVDHIHAHDIGSYLAQKNIAVRVGKHCAYPLHEKLNIVSSIRVSLGIYNDTKDIDFFYQQMLKCIEFFNEV